MSIQLVKVAVIPGKDFPLQHHSVEEIRENLIDGQHHQIIVYSEETRREIFQSDEKTQFEMLISYLKELNNQKAIKMKDPSELKKY